jgi:two-component system chemotaxis response regulator CheY
MKALVVDDSSTMRIFLKKILVPASFEVLQAPHGKDALEVLRQHPDICLTLIDWNMPQMNGMDLLTSIRADHAFDGMRIMMVTTEMEMSSVVRALERGANEYVMKPFTREVILEKLRILGFAVPEEATQSAL